MRRCPRCGRTLPESDFYRMGNRLQGWCRECSRSYNREWRRNNPGKRYRGGYISHGRYVKPM